MSNEQKSNTEQHQFWQMALETYKSSGLSVRNFCKQEGLSEPAFYAWRKKLTKGDDPKKDRLPPTRPIKGRRPTSLFPRGLSVCWKKLGMQGRNLGPASGVTVSGIGCLFGGCRRFLALSFFTFLQWIRRVFLADQG